MKPEYITLNNGRKVRIEWNMNAVAEYTAISGRELTDLTAGKADVLTLRTIAWCAAQEGEAADGKELGMNDVELGRLMSMAAMVQFSEILTRQMQGTQKKSVSLLRFPPILFRKKG